MVLCVFIWPVCEDFLRVLGNHVFDLFDTIALYPAPAIPTSLSSPIKVPPTSCGVYICQHLCMCVCLHACTCVCGPLSGPTVDSARASLNA